MKYKVFYNDTKRVEVLSSSEKRDKFASASTWLLIKLEIRENGFYQDEFYTITEIAK